MKKFSKILICSILSVFLMVGSVMALPLPLPTGGFMGGYQVNVNTWTVASSNVQMLEAWYLDGTYKLLSGDNVFFSQVAADMNGWAYDISADMLTISPSANNPFSISNGTVDYLTGTLSEYNVTKLGSGEFRVWALLNNMTYDAQGSQFIEEFEQATSSADRAQVLSYHISMGNINDDILSVNVQGKLAPVPEPATMLLFGCGLLGIGVLRRKRFVKNV